MAAWNPKVVSVERQSERPLCLAERFAMTSMMSGKTRRACVEVTACEAPSILTFRYEMADGPRAGFVEETFTLKPSGSTTCVRQTITLGSGIIPWFFRPVVWFVHRFGRPVEEPHLSRLRRLVETSVLDSTSTGHP